ncbi:MAG: hypothetical protein PPP56_11870 [Longimonas sp.]|uniref:hypothetical protein n=1 Tax=Longimonas sp. TaxID=2039626 RepID=UPI00334ED73D
MPDTSLHEDSSSHSFPQDASAEEVWAKLCSLLNTEDPSAVVSRVLSVHERVHGDEEAHALSAYGLPPVEETEALLHDVRTRLHTLREHNESLVEQLDSDEELRDIKSSQEQLEALIDLVEADSFEATKRQIQSLQDQVDALYEEKEQLVAAGFASVDEALNEIDRLTDTCEALRDQLSTGDSEVASGGDADSDASPPELYVDRPTVPPAHVQAAASEKPGASPQVKEALQQALEIFRRRLDDAPQPLNEDASLHEQVEQIQAYAQDLDASWEHIVGPAQTLMHEAKDTLGMVSIADFEAIAQRIERLADITTTLHASLSPYLDGLTASIKRPESQRAAEQLQRIVSHLQRLHGAVQSSDALAGAQGLDPEIGRILGVSSVQDARDMVQIVQRMAEQLDQKKAAAQKRLSTLTELMNRHVLVDADALQQLHHLLGHSVTIDPVDSQDVQRVEIRPVNDELQARIEAAAGYVSGQSAPDTLGKTMTALQNRIETLKRDNEVQRSASRKDSAAQEKLAAAGLNDVEDAIDMIESMSSQLSELYAAQEATINQAQKTNDGQSTFQQLEALYAEQDKLQRELGVSDADALISMVDTMNAQLNDLYREREQTPDASDTQNEEIIASMSEQLSTLYEQIEVLYDKGIEDPEDAVDTIETLEQEAEELSADIERLRARIREQESTINKLKQLQADGEVPAQPQGPDPRTTDSAQAQSESESRSSGTNASKKKTSQFELSATAPIFGTDRLNALRTEPPHTWDDHSVGVIQVGDDGTVHYINEAACRLPRLQETDPQELVGQNFFKDLALSTNNDLFRGRFEKGTQHDAMRVCFPYTFIAPGHAPVVFNVHMHRAPGSTTNWILLQTP